LPVPPSYATDLLELHTSLIDQSASRLMVGYCLMEGPMMRSVSRKIRNALRRDRRDAPPVEVLLARLKRGTPEQQAIRRRAEELYSRLHARGATWSACVHAVKTDWVACQCRSNFPHLCRSKIPQAVLCPDQPAG